MDEKVIEGWLYEDVEDAAIIITDEKIKLQDVIDYWKKPADEGDPIAKDIIEEAKKEIPKGIVRFCSLIPNYEYEYLADLLDEFKGKKVRITVEILEEGDVGEED